MLSIGITIKYIKGKNNKLYNIAHPVNIPNPIYEEEKESS